MAGFNATSGKISFTYAKHRLYTARAGNLSPHEERKDPRRVV
jgi:hypothetical protein